LFNYFGFFGSYYNYSVDSVKSSLHNVKYHMIIMLTGRYRQQSFWNWGYFPHLLKHQDIWSIRSILKEL